MASAPDDAAQRTLLRWRLVLGPEQSRQQAGGIWAEAEQAVQSESGLGEVDRALDFLYGDGGQRGGSEASSPYVASWLGDIRRYFSRDVVAFMEKDAIERRGLRQLLLEPEALQSLQKDVGLVATILAFKHLMPEQTRETARQVVREIVDDLRKRLENETRQALLGAMRRDRHSPLRVARNLDLKRTVREGLRNYQPSLRKIVPERVHFFANQQRFHEWRVIILVDQSGSMGESVVYSSIVAAVFASLPALDTRLVFFDTAVADVTDQLSDPVEMLFGVQLGGGTDIARAVQYGASLVTQPEKTLLLLITDLIEGGSRENLLAGLGALKESRAHVLCVLALNDKGTASFDADMARKVAALDIPTFAATPGKLVDAVERALRGDGRGADDVV
ncbi:MAG: VWA domain-containing protein [Chloroflexi bacterium]|nr:VWA domain-containing protein [Chloroflexota bacterium]